MLEPPPSKRAKELLDAQIIFKDFYSTWDSNLVPIRKNYKGICLCVDFQNLNQPLDKDLYLILFMDKILEMISQLEMLLLFDGLSRYNHVLIANPHIYNTIFRAKWGIFTFQHVHFLIINVGATFQWAMDIMFQILIGQSVVVYFHDVTLLSKKIYNHFVI